MEEESSSSSSEDEGEGDSRDKSATETLPASRLPPSLEPPRQDQVIIKKDYDPKSANRPVKEMLRPLGPEGYTISPITGEKIPFSKVQEHFRIGLLDPRWKEERDRQLMEKQNQELVYAPGKIRILYCGFYMLKFHCSYCFGGFYYFITCLQVSQLMKA